MAPRVNKVLQASPDVAWTFIGGRDVIYLCTGTRTTIKTVHSESPLYTVF